MVTPVFKASRPLTDVETVASDGSRLMGTSLGGFSGAVNLGAIGAAYEFMRGVSGWSTTPVDPPASLLPGSPQFGEFGYAYDAGNGGRALLGARSVSQPQDAEDLYVREPDGSLTEVGPEAPESALAGPTEDLLANADSYFEYRGASSDLSHVLFNIYPSYFTGGRNYRWSFDSTYMFAEESLYEYVGTGNTEPLLVGVTGPEGSHSLVSQCGTLLGGPGSERYNAVSSDGSKVFFTALGEDWEPCGETQPSVNELFTRINQSETVAISEPTSTDCSACTGTPEDARFAGASSDGSKVFFTTSQELFAGNSGTNLYEYDFNGEAGHKVTLISGGEEPANVLGVARVSEDGSHVYFVAEGKLTNEPDPWLKPGHQVAESRQPNLYVYDTNTGQLGFVATLTYTFEEEEEVWERDVRSVQATPDGRFLLFSSAAQLTPGDTSTGRQLFRYDSQTGELVRVSIGENGFNRNGNGGENASFPRQRFVLSFAKDPVVAMSNDGQYVFFESSDGLTQLAINDPSNTYKNVYEYHDGNVYLISDGQDRSLVHTYEESAVRLVGTDSSGKDVFFTTSDPLVPRDTDTGQDVYDARVDGGFPSPATTECEGDGCQGTLSTPPSLPVGGSALQPGGGNLTPPPSQPAVKPTPKRLTRAQKRAKALRACAKKPKKRRAACRKRAKRKYGHSSKAKKSNRRGK
ncbi:MAG: hypothetical protein ACRDK7_09515 [Solirubrobacteraceae bacterium]